MRNNEKGDLPLDSTTWRNEVSVFGPLAFLIGARRLGKLEPGHKGLEMHTLKDVDSYCFSKRMARHLMSNCKNILKVRGLLRGVPTGKLLSSGESGIDGMDNLREIVQNIPADLPARTALVFRKMRENLGVFENLKAILRNPYPEQFVSLLTLQETRTFYKGLFSHWTRVQSENLVDKIHFLPDSVLSNLLGSPKKLGKESNLSSHLESKALGGLTCERLLAVDTSAFPETVAAMRHARKRVGKTDMAKKLQRCARVALDRFLVERAAATYESQKAAMATPASVINPVDIANFGGFVMATFTPAEIAGNPFAKDIMKEVGSLSAYELLSAVPCYKCLRKMAETAVDIINGGRNMTLSHLLDLGSLVGFLPAALIDKIHPADWRIIVESAALDGSSEPLCTDEESRDAWEKIIRAAFGEPEHWTAHTLASIGGYMPAMRESSLHAVSLDERALAGDTIGLTSGAPYLHGVDIVGFDHPRPFWKVCRDLLVPDERKDFENSLFNAARFQLYSAQLFASKVKSADVLKELKTMKRQSTYKAATEAPPALTTEASPPPPKFALPWDPFKMDETWEPTTQDPSYSTKGSSLWNTANWNPFRPAGSIQSTTLIPEEASPNKETVAPTFTDANKFPDLAKPSEDKKLEISEDLDDFMSKAFEETDLKPSTSVTEVPTESTPAGTETVPVTEEPEEETTYGTWPVTEASLHFLQGQELSNKPSEVNTSSQVYVDPESGGLGESMEEGGPQLQLSMKDLPTRIPAAPPTAKPALKTNGTVYGLPNISVPVEPSSEPSSEATPVEGDDTLVISASTNRSEERVDKAEERVAKATIPPATEPPSVSSPGATPNPSISASTPNTAGATRRRRDVSVQGFEVPLTCDGLLTMGPAAALALSLSDVDMAYEELEDCVEFIGKLELPKELAEAFWKKLKMAAHWDTVGDLGCLVAGMSIDEVANLKLDTSDDHFLDTISAISSYADKQVLVSVISKLKSRLDEEIKRNKTVALAEEIVLALGPNVCLLPPDTRSFLVNTPKVLVRSLSGINRQEWFHRSACNPECIRGLLSVLVNQNKSREWLADDFRSAGLLVAGFSEQELEKMSSIKTSQMFAEMSAGATRCLSPSQFKAMRSEPLMWLSPVAAGALSEDHLGVVPEEQRGALKSAVFGRPGIDAIQGATGTSAATDFTSSLALIVILATLVVKCHLL